MSRLANKRNRRIDHYLHTASKRIIDVLVKEDIGVVCIGKNDAWKQEANMGKRVKRGLYRVSNGRSGPGRATDDAGQELPLRYPWRTNPLIHALWIPDSDPT